MELNQTGFVKEWIYFPLNWAAFASAWKYLLKQSAAVNNDQQSRGGGWTQWSTHCCSGELVVHQSHSALCGRKPGLPSLRMAVFFSREKEGMEKRGKQERAVQKSEGERSCLVSRGKDPTECSCFCWVSPLVPLNPPPIHWYCICLVDKSLE